MKTSTERNHQHYIAATDSIGKCRIMGHLDTVDALHIWFWNWHWWFFFNQHGVQKRIVLSSNILSLTFLWITTKYNFLDFFHPQTRRSQCRDAAEATATVDQSLAAWGPPGECCVMVWVCFKIERGRTKHTVPLDSLLDPLASQSKPLQWFIWFKFIIDLSANPYFWIFFISGPKHRPAPARKWRMTCAQWLPNCGPRRSWSSHPTFFASRLNQISQIFEVVKRTNKYSAWF